MLLKATDITKAYAGVQALRRASFELRAGEVHALIGENGAGKSTLIKIITGAVTADSGTLELNGQLLSANSPRQAKRLGIAAIYQQPALFPELTVAENIALGVEPTGLWRRVDWNARRRRARALLAQVSARIDPDVVASELTMPQQQLVEIARALGAEAKVLILDEPTASLSEEDTQNLFRVLRELRARGVGLIYISHRLEELPLIADRVTVLRDGQTIETRLMAEVNREGLIQLMVGRQLSAVFPKRAVALGEVVLELRGLSCSASGLSNVHLQLRAGEIVGLAGLVGAGRTALARTIFGLTPADAGEILLRGQLVRFNDPAQAIAAGVAYVPEDRRRHGVILDLPISHNITLASLAQLARRGRLDLGREREIAADYTRRLSIKTPAIFAPVHTLSGGNQQKVALSRWLLTKPTVLILDEPTQGIDVGAKAELHHLMIELAAQGVAILMISSELPEILGMSDRIAVMRGGTMVGVLLRAEATQQAILGLALGHDHNLQQLPETNMGRIRQMINVNGRESWTLFDSGARNTYIVPAVAAVLTTVELAQPLRSALGGAVQETKQAALLEAEVEGLPLSTHALVLDQIGHDKEGRPIEVLFGALAMQQWGIRLILDQEKLDLSHYSREFVEY